MNEILKILNRELKELREQDEFNTKEIRLLNDKRFELLKQTQDLQQEKRVLMQQINDLTDNK